MLAYYKISIFGFIRTLIEQNIKYQVSCLSERPLVSLFLNSFVLILC
jgi:hypothetical protein